MHESDICGDDDTNAEKANNNEECEGYGSAAYLHYKYLRTRRYGRTEASL
jgi:hypothetical protein